MYRYPPVQTCIYCDAESYAPNSNSLLTEEHIIPLCLCGNLILEQASCRKCERETGKAEQLALQGVYRALREKLNYPHRHKERPRNEFPIFVPTLGGKDRRIDIPLHDYPHTHFFLTPPAAGLLLGIPLHFTYDFGQRWFRTQATFEDGEAPANLKKYGVDKVFAIPSLDLLSFSRMLAKIGHAYAVAERGKEGFTPLLRDLILGTEKRAFHFVGGKPDSAAYPPSANPYEIGIEEQKVDGVAYLVVNIRIFATEGGSPTYQTVVGILPG